MTERLGDFILERRRLLFMRRTMTDLEHLVLQARDIGLTEKEIARYLLAREEEVQRIIEIEEATCQQHGKS